MDITKAPINETLQGFNFPEYFTTNGNGRVKVIYYPDFTQPLTEISVIIPKGAAFEKIDGLAYFSTQLMKRGTQNKTSEEIAESVDLLGAVLNFSSSWDFSSFSLTCLGDFFERASEILFDCIMNPIFPEKEIKKYKKKHIAEVKQEMADPSYLANLTLLKTFFSGHPYGHPLLGNKKSINSLSQNDCIEYHKELMSSDKISIIISGNITKDEANAISSKYVNSFNKVIEPVTNSINEIKHDRTKIIIANKKDVKQTALRIAKTSIGRHNPDFPVLQFVNTVFGGFFLSRLNELLREKLGYTYGVKSYINTRKLGAAFVVSTSINKNATADTVQKVIEEMDKISSQPIELEEIRLARQYLLGSFVRSLETPHQITSLLKTIIIDELQGNYFEYFYNKVSKITQEELFEVQKKYLKPDGLVISAVGDSKYLNDELGNLGIITQYK